MQVRIKKFDVAMEVKANGIEFEVKPPRGGEQLGDCLLTMVGLTWCVGRTSKARGNKITWGDFMEIMKSDASIKAAVSAAKKTSNANTKLNK